MVQTRLILSLAASALALPANASAQDTAGLAPPVRIMSAGAPIDVTVGHAAPYVIDFDGDGLRDLLVGEFGDQPYPQERLPEGAKGTYEQGRLRIYRNCGTNAAPIFKGFEYLRAGKEYASIPST